MDRRITIAFVAILVLLGGYIWYTFLRADAPPVEPVTPSPTSTVFLNVGEDQVQAVEVQDVKNNKITRISRDGDNWKMEQPAQGLAYAANVNEFLFSVTNVEAERKLAPQSDLAPFGLNPPQYQLKLELKSGDPIQVQLGNENSEGSAYYVTKQGDSAIYLISSTTADDIKNFITTPPYTPTPTATPGPTETPASAGTPEATATP